ncbi:FAST kinase domain-containing protein 5, mitochondrial-like [Homarus americanus]|uniref:FAST kinase domain-containing protein 5-like 1 n=1 Tax=Homarus americanus TaxID=6706 RepID=A0A8J5JIF1_HOMAM|nr:FAST kinase domain-containing protein 5, mitochondrial-like [Homarus americanus]XP_042240546.1 FAST kinase domain-containing protein 5, mitochondrial-like [Homarus americanus]KAG7158607.1 FAST kinase domain-containing protein 5-like 1 [Homarus americanus]
MLRALTRHLKGPFRNALIQTVMQKHWKVLGSPKILAASHNYFPVRQYAIRPKETSFMEENTLSNKILQYMRTNTKYAAVDSLSIGQVQNNTFSDAYAMHQLLLVISHSLIPKTKDILKLFSLYKLPQHSILQDMISKKSLMLNVKRKVIESLSHMTENELRNFASALKELKFVKTRYLMDIARNIDLECDKRTYKADLEKCLHLFDILLILYGNNVYRRKQYDNFMALFETHIESAQPQDLVQILYYVGIGKRRKLSRDFVDLLVRKLETHYEDLSFHDAGIAAASVFKSNVKVSKYSSFIKKTANHLQTKVKECPCLNDLDSYGLVAMMKILRAAQYQDHRILSSLNSFIMHNNADNLSPQFIAHTLALYANSCVYEPDVFSRLEELILQHLKAPLLSVRIRDLSRILWAFSHVNHQCCREILSISDKSLMEFIHNGEVDIYPQFLSSTLLSMAMMGHYPQPLIKEAFKHERIHQLQDYQKSKQLSRLLTLNECLKVELPELTVALPDISKSNLPTRTLVDEVQHRPALATLLKGAKFINEIVGAPVLKLKFPIAYINYASLVYDASELKGNNCNSLPSSTSQRDHVIQQLSAVKDNTSKQQISIELIDSQSTLSTSQPIGMVKLKIQLMNKSGWEVRKIYSGDVETCSNDEQAIGALILDELTKVCYYG